MVWLRRGTHVGRAASGGGGVPRVHKAVGLQGGTQMASGVRVGLSEVSLRLWGVR